MRAGWMNSSSISFGPQDSEKRYHPLSLIEEGQKSMEIVWRKVYSFFKARKQHIWHRQLVLLTLNVLAWDLER